MRAEVELLRQHAEADLLGQMLLQIPREHGYGAPPCGKIYVRDEGQHENKRDLPYGSWASPLRLYF